jgi:hypothetical protein
MALLATPLLARAFDYRRGVTETRTATRIVDRRHSDPEVVKLGPGQWLVDGELVAAAERHADPNAGAADRPGSCGTGPPAASLASTKRPSPPSRWERPDATRFFAEPKA